jgi:hypothetical protein
MGSCGFSQAGANGPTPLAELALLSKNMGFVEKSAEPAIRRPVHKLNASDVELGGPGAVIRRPV